MPSSQSSRSCSVYILVFVSIIIIINIIIISSSSGGAGGGAGGGSSSSSSGSTSSSSSSSVLFSLPRCFEFKLVDDEVRYQFIPTALTHNRVYVIFYRTSLFFVFARRNEIRSRPGESSLFFVVMYLAPMSLMMILNGLLLAALRRSQRSRVTTLCYYLLTNNVTLRHMTLV